MKELEDYSWFPKKLRKFQVEFIGYVVEKFGLYKPIVPIIASIYQKQKCESIIDLCSGSGAPSKYMQQHLQQTIPILLTDKYPQEIEADNSISYLQESKDVLAMPFETAKLYTMYNAFHHFTNAEQITIINKCKNANASIVIVEVLTPNILTLVNVLLSSTIIQLLVAPFIKPFSWLRLLFTYIIPVNILTITIDGIISVFKSKSKKQYQKLLQPLQTKNYSIETSSIFNLGNQLIVTISHPIL